MGLLAQTKKAGLLSQPATQPIQKTTSPTPLFSGGISLTDNLPKPMAQSTPVTTNFGTTDAIKAVAKTAKDVVTGADNTTGGIIRNTVEAIPGQLVKTGAGLLNGLKEQFTNPSSEQKNYESTILPYATTPVTKVLTAPGVATARMITRFLNPGLQPIATDIAEIRAVNEKNGLADQVASGKIPASVLDEIAVLHKTAPQVVGDVAQAVLTAYAGGEAPGVASEAKNLGVREAVTKGFGTGIKVGTLFGGAQALSSGSTNPAEIAGIVGTSGLAGGVLGAITSGAIPVSKEILEHVQKAKEAYDAMTPAQKQGGYIKNPFAGKPIEPELQSLADEAKKYKSADEFHDALFNGTKENKYKPLSSNFKNELDNLINQTKDTVEKMKAENPVVSTSELSRKIISDFYDEATGTKTTSPTESVSGASSGELPLKSTEKLPQEQSPANSLKSDVPLDNNTKPKETVKVEELPIQQTTEGRQTKQVIKDQLFPSPEKITKPEDVLLKEKLKNQAKGADVGFKAGMTEGMGRGEVQGFFEGSKSGYKKGQVEAKISITNQLRNTFETKISDIKRGAELGDLKTKIKVRDWERVKGEIVKYANDNLPLSERGKLMTVVRDAKTQSDLVKAFGRIDKKVDEVAIKTSITDLKNTVAKLSDSNAVSADYKAKIKDIIDAYELSGHSDKTIEKLKATQAYIDRQVKAGENADIPQRIVDKLKILERTPKDELTLSQIQGLKDEVALLGKLGETKWSSKQALYEGEKELRKKELLDSASAINSKQYKNIGLEKDPPKYMETYIKARNYLQKTRVGLTPIEGLADITGMQPMKRVMDSNFGDYISYNEKPTKQWYDLTKDFNEDDFKKIGAYAIAQQDGGLERLVNNGITQKQIDDLNLTPEQKKAYDFVRETFDGEFPKVQKYALDVYNKDVGGVKNYVSFMADNNAMNELELYDRFGSSVDSASKTKTVEQGFTESRAKLADTKMELNIDKIFRRHTDDVAYMLTMGRDIKQYFEIVNSPEMRAKLGDVGSTAWLQYLDLMARKGGSEGAKRIAVLDMLRSNLSAGVLAFRISSAMVQFTSFADTMGTIGAEWATKGATAMASKDWRNFVMDNFPEVRKSVGDDIAFREFGDGFLSKVAQKGLIPLEKLDGLMRTTAVAGAYMKLAEEKGIKIDFKNPDKNLVNEATKLMRHSQGSSFFKDQPLSLTTDYGLMDNKSINKTILSFQSFVLSRWDNLERQIWRTGLKEGNYAKASMSFLWLVVLASAMETGIRRGVQVGVNKTTQLFTGKETDTNNGTFLHDSSMNVLQSIPLAGQLISSMQYSSNPVPLINAFEQAISGGSSIVSGKDPVTKVRGAVTTAGAVGSILGIPGSSQGSQLIKGLIPPANSKTPEETAYNKKVKAESDAKAQVKSDFMPTYNKVQELIKKGDQIGADALVQKMSDDEYATYKSIRTSEREKNSSKLKTLVNTDPAGAVKFVRSQTQAEQDRLLKNMSDDEYKLYENGKSTSPETSQKSSDNKPVSMIKAGAKALFGAKTASAAEMPQKNYYIRDNSISEPDLQEAKAIIFGEVSNRTPEKQKLEAQSILNTAFNRMDEYRKHGKEYTLTQVLQMPNQYQAYQKPLYTRFKKGDIQPGDKQKIDAIDSVLNDVRGGNFINNIGKDVSYTHKSDGRIIVDNRKLFK